MASKKAGTRGFLNTTEATSQRRLESQVTSMAAKTASKIAPPSVPATKRARDEKQVVLKKVAKTATVKTAGAKFSKGSATSDDDNGSVTGEFHAGTIAVNEFQAILAGDPDRCSSSGGSSSAASSPAESMFSATSGSASSSVSATALPDAEAVLKKIEREQRNFIPKAKSMTATEHVSREAVALRSHLINKNARILALEAAVRSLASAASRPLEMSNNTVAIATTAAKQASEMVQSHTMMGELKRENNKLQAEVIALKKQLAELPEQSAAAASELGEAQAATDELRSQLLEAVAERESLQKQYEQTLAAHDAAHQATIKAKDAEAAAERVRLSSEASAQLKSSAAQAAAAATKAMQAKMDEAQAKADQLQRKLEAELEKKSKELLSTCTALEKLKKAKAESDADAADRYASERDRAERAEAEAAMFRAKFEACDEKRLRLLDQVQTLKGNIRVFVRVRPALPSELKKAGTATEAPLFQFPAATLEATELNMVEKPGAGVGGYGVATESKRTPFEFQRVFPPTATQGELFEEVEGLVQSALDGHRVCIFAYGQTGSGKTYTMEGAGLPSAASPAAGSGAGASSSSSSRIDAASEDRGLIPRSVEYIFARIQAMEEQGWSVTMSAEMLEIYNEIVRDLLAGKASKSAGDSGLDIKHNPKDDSFHVPSLSVHVVASPAEVYSLLVKASSSRATGSTNSNAVSSRSHSVFTLRISAKHAATAQQRTGVLNLIDLAGSEKLDKSGAASDPKLLKETQNINTSLSALQRVIEALHQKAGHIPYRDGKLTQVLKSSFDRSTKTLLIANVAPVHEHAEESRNTLRFATRVSEVEIVASSSSSGGKASKKA